MKILFDCSILGAAANSHQRGTIGIFRVVEHNARAIATAAGVEAWFHARGTWRATHRYYTEHLAPGALAGSSAHFAGPGLPGGRLADGIVTAADDYFARHYPHPPWSWLTSGRVCWAGTRLLLRGAEPAATRGLDIYHSPTGAFPTWTTRRPGLRRFLTIYDFIPLIRPDFFPPAVGRRLRTMLASITPEDWTLSISESSRRDLLAHCPACNPDRALVVPLAAEDIFHPETDLARIAAVRTRYGIAADTPYFLSVSTLEPRKNFETVIRAFARFVREDPTRPACLVLVGGQVRTDIHSIFAAAEAEGESFRARVIFAGFVPDDDLAALYSGALAFLYLSFYEGFGLPPLEAMQCGVPVIASNTSSLPEVVGDAGRLLDPLDEAGVAGQLRALYLDAAQRRELSARAIARAATFRWEYFAAAVLAAYRRALAEPP